MRQHVAQANELQGRVIAVTGANGAIGQALSVAAAKLGAQLILIGRNVQALESVHAACGESVIAPLNFERAVAQDYDQLAAAVTSRFGRLDGLVHCAAQLGTLSPLADYDVPTWCRVLHVNVTAAFALTQVLLPALNASSDASVIFSDCAMGRTPAAFWGAYAVSKAAVGNLARVLADEYASDGRLRVNTIDPGPTRSALRRAAFPAENLHAARAAESAIAPYLWLLSSEARGVTGQLLLA
jgi:NAD(P)-dependent dehydrogenase (short-subunit alcohol dehydrogenase family)